MSSAVERTIADVAVVGAGAAGLATAIFTARRVPNAVIVALDSARKLGAKILVSGGGRCNVTNVKVTPADFCGGNPNHIRRILAGFNEHDTVHWFADLGVPLHEEEFGKLFPDSHDAHTVLNALLNEACRRQIRLLTEHRVTRIEPVAGGFRITCEGGPAPTERTPDQSPAVATDREVTARIVVLAAGGMSLPKTGSDGSGYALAKSLNHAITPPVPALVPLVLDGEFHSALAGISHPAEITARVEGDKPVRVAGPMLWTHFGASGPAVMDVSRHWHRAEIEHRPVRLNLNFLPGFDFSSAERRLLELAEKSPRTQIHNALVQWLPARLIDAILRHLGLDSATPCAHFAKEARRKLVHALTDWPLPVRTSRGFAHAEVTSGGVPLDEIETATMSSKMCANLFLVGEIVDVDGRIGGFNFQWAWSTAWIAAEGIARRIQELRAADSSP